MNQLDLLIFNTEPGKLPALTVNEVLDNSLSQVPIYPFFILPFTAVANGLPPSNAV
ncbi:hypothetical protein Phpb_02139 [Photorhabdus namnaonensis]|uniref:Uncharacterized protein n=1 Tax=Photorhabdus namnaonensis TaxID=1851568 RepID=A0A1B8YI36_9GAMM|nr:hypothetical protein Phpb_02139 [Photorhabdus namnaonensis]